MTQESSVYIAQDMTQPQLTHALGGSVVVISSRCPDKTSSNEDAAAVIRCDQDSAGVLVVADGMGGGAGGEQASKIAIETIGEQVSRISNLETSSLRSAILNGIEAANTRILDLGIGAATTLAAVEIQERTIRPYHVGDSSILVVGQRGKVKLQTVDHSPVGLAIEAGVLSDEEGMCHEERHLVTNILGTANMRIEIGSMIRLSKFDTVLLATDGIFDNLSTQEVASYIRKGPLLAGVRELTTAARSRMANCSTRETPSKPDDATVIAYRASAT